MSYRAIQRLREEREPTVRDDEGSDSEDDDDVPPARASGFAATFMDDSSSSSGDESEDEEDDAPVKHDADEHSITKEGSGDQKAAVAPSEEKEEDLDELLNEFKLQDDEAPKKVESSSTSTPWFDIITSSIDLRDLDFDFVMRTSLLGSGDSGPSSRSGNRRGKQSNLFGPPKDGWPRAPRYVGGGIGMVTYESNPRQLPWPYSDLKTGDERCAPDNNCFSFQYSDSYQRDCRDYERVQMSGDVNMLALFCAHHPFSIDALLQLSTVLYQTSQSQEGRTLIQRILWVYECSFLNSFIKKTFGFMDHDIHENQAFFETLFRMVRISHVAGLPRAALAYSKLLLSLDPLRDPKNMLLVLDHFVTLANTKEDDEWLVDFIDSETISIFERRPDGSTEYECHLDCLPNLAYSYALALYRTFQREKTSESEEKAKDAMKRALVNFPSVFERILSKNDIDVSSTTFQKGLQYTKDRSILVLNAISSRVEDNKEIQSRITQAYDLTVRIFVDANFKLWSLSNIHAFMLNCIEELGEVPVTPLDPALLRYANCDPVEFVDRFQTMPAEANPLDRGLVAHAMNVETNRPRFMQRAVQGGRDDQMMEMIANAQQQGFAGPPTEMIDPDWPLLEVFWRSALPWAHVEGVERPPE
mmetsp:Transcript_2931/g.6910  ORF Transcript_2931/g.6910 Transcript_2931/m.6910 type:complete len:643 (-) Transcript_2931:1589-3517(-)